MCHPVTSEATAKLAMCMEAVPSDCHSDSWLMQKKSVQTVDRDPDD